ncbi:nitrogenase iron-iron protein delta chain [Geotalea uraniireducens]|uniref:Nitrogenase iron-iron protein delta chain n=1 Tax=Geotalea uraniireducens TaxID=351604 RepID=A0ABN6VR31_9BACT|nr:Fe-only nitrogenase subunit delta [Geotalea uraniireducens]BDV41616.1 nitrogenase iron-iron protein delta chain [Geotalea uraniireducens]
MAAKHKIKNLAERKYQKVYTSDPLATVSPETREKIGQLENYLMKHCLWQFNSRGWDRRKQNAGILGQTAQLLCDEEVNITSPLDKCYWVDAVMLNRAYRELFPWITEMPKEDVKALMRLLNARLDWTLIDGSLNLELTVVNY